MKLRTAPRAAVDAGHHRRVMRRTTIAGEGPTAEPPLATRTPAWEGIIAPGLGV
jgi:hypothetical protein